MSDIDREDDDRRPGGYSVRGGSAKDVEVVGRRRIVRRETPRLRLDSDTIARIRDSGPPEPPASGPSPFAHPGSRPPGPPPSSPSSVDDTRRLPTFGGAGVVGSSAPPPKARGPVITLRPPSHPAMSARSSEPAARADDTAPVPALALDGARVESAPEPTAFDEDESGVLPRGIRPRTPPVGLRRTSRTPPLGVQLDPPTPAVGVPLPDDELPGVVHGELREAEPTEPRPRARRVRETPGFRPPSSRPPAAPRDRRTPPVGGDVPRAERVRSGGIDAISSVPPPPPSGPERQIPDDPAARAIRILETLRSCGPDDEGPAVAALQKIGLPALEPMEREFPGLLWFHRRVAHRRLPRGKDVGSLARAIVAFGEPTVPMLRRTMENGDIDQRFYAVLIAGDVMPRCREAARSAALESLGRRLRDVDAQVSDAALHVLMAYREDPANRSMIGSFIIQMSDLSATPADRVFATRVLGVLRCAPALSAFVERLDDPSAQVRDAARKALRLLTGEDLGSSRRKWASWAKKHGREPRVRWLIEGLVHRDEDLRAMAHRELEKVAAPDFSYSPTSSRGERKRVYRQCLAWYDEQFG